VARIEMPTVATFISKASTRARYMFGWQCEGAVTGLSFQRSTYPRLTGRAGSILAKIPIPAFGRRKLPFLLHRRVLRLTLTRTSVRNTIISKFRRLRRDSRSLVRGQFL